ncbi:Protein purity of essence [Taenia crassiceps]|uniref:Protein purity of essence n=1 Tax=Taenia crassiceps TaxID=6207 RepID=A0ABR4Q629_9CEST
MENHSILKPSITWLVNASLLEISRSGADSSADSLYGLRVLLSEISIPQRLCESEFQKLLANSGGKDTSLTPTSTPSESSKKKVKKAQIAKELWDDVSLAVSELNGDHALRISNTYSSIARAVFWKQRGDEVLLSCLQNLLKLLQNFPKVNLKSIVKKVCLLCQILRGALSDPANPTCTLPSMPPMFVNNWIKSVFKIMLVVVQILAPVLFTRSSECIETASVAADVFDNMVLLREAFFSLFFTSDKRRVECSELDAAHLWFNLCLISNYCLPSSNAPLKLLCPTPTSFAKFTTFALESLRGELQNSSISTSILVNRLPWSREGEGGSPAETVSVNSPSEWARALSSVDAYERFVLEADFRQSLVLSSPLDVFLLDLASAFFVAAKNVKSESTDGNTLLLCAENAIVTLCSLLQLRDMQNTLSTASDKDAFIRSLVHFISLHPEPLGRCLTALFCVLAPTSLTSAALSHLHLLPPDPQLSLDPQPPVSFRLLATYLLDASRSHPSVIETYCTSAVSFPFTDLPPHMAQLISLLSGAFSTHASKKTLLSAIVDALIDPVGVELLRSLRLVVLLRYQLHYIFDPPRHLNAQVRPTILGTEKVVWEFANLVGRGPSEGYFYDLLHGKSKTNSTTPSAVCPAPPQDGLAIMTLVARADYDRVFTSMLLLFDSWWQSTLLHAAYGAQLSWRLLEILPPSAGFMEEISSVVNGAELEENCAHHRVIYLIVLFDRLRRLPTSISSSSFTLGNAEKEAKRSRHRIEAVANETFKAQSSRLTKSTKPAFSSVEGYEVFFSVLRSYKTHLPVLFTEALNQLRGLQSGLNDRIHLTESELVFWRVVVHALRTLVSRIQTGGKLHTPGESEPPPLPMGGSAAAKRESNEPPKICSTGTQSSDSVGVSAEEGPTSKKPGLNPELSYFLDSFLQIAISMMECLLQQLRAEVGFSCDGVVECLCPERLVVSDIGNSFLLDNVVTRRLVDALRCASSSPDEEGGKRTEGAFLYTWNNLVRENGPWDWPISETDTLSQIAFNRLTNAPVESTSIPRSVLVGCLLKETALFAEAIVRSPRGSMNVGLFHSISKEEVKKILITLFRLQLNPLISSLSIDLADVLHFYAAHIKNTHTETVLTRTTEDFVLDTLVSGAVNVNSKHLRAEIFAYLEVATGLPRVLRRFGSGDLPLFKGSHSNPVPVEYLRLFCLFLLRATNPQSNVELYTAAAKQALQIALNDKVIVKAVASVLNNKEDILSQQSQRFCVFVERMLRLIAAPWAGAEKTKRLCQELILCEVEQHAFDFPIRGHYIISGMRCLILVPGNGSVVTYSRFALVLARWAEMGQNYLTVEKCAERKKNILLTLCAIYDYFGLFLRAYTPSTPVDSDSLALPDPHYTGNRNCVAVRGFKNPDLTKFFSFFTHSSSGDDDDGPHQMRLGSGWNSALDNTLLYALCGPAVGRNTMIPPLLSTLPFHQSASSPLERACEEVCTFASTQHHYIRQPWYGCNTCGIITNHGPCHLCAKVCHRGHNLVYQNTSEFSCDCATEMGQVGKCHSVMRRVAGGCDGLLENILPWTNVTCFQPSVYDKACDLITKAAYRRSPASVEATSATTAPNPLSTTASATNTSNTAPPIVSACSSITPVTTTTTGAPALPPRNSEWVTVESGSSDANIIHRIRRAGALRRRPGLVTSKSTSREGGSGGASTGAALATSQPPIDLVPCLSVSYGLGSEEGLQKKFNLWAMDTTAPRRQAIESFQRKFGRRPQPSIEALVNRLRNQMPGAKETDQRCMVRVIRSQAIFRGARNLLREEFTPLLHSATASFADVFKRVAEPENLRSSAIRHLTSANRKSPHRVIISSRLVTPVLLFDSDSTSITNEIFKLFSPLPASTIPSQPITPVTTPNLPSSVFSALNPTIIGGRQRKTATDLSSLHHWIADVFAPRPGQHLFGSSAAVLSPIPSGSTAIEGRAENSNASDSIATLARVPSVSGWRHYLLIAMALPSPSHASRSHEEGLVTIFQVDDLFATAATCQENVEGAVEVASEAARDTSPPGLRSFVVRLSTLPRVSKINCGFEVTRLAVHPTNEAVFTANNQQMCLVFGLSTLGQVCGRLLINPLVESKDEFVIKPIWLPGSSRFIALLTTKSVQIFDVFTSSPKLLYYFKPVEGNFVDATFIHAPRRHRVVTNDNDPAEFTIDKYYFSDVILVVMATFGSMMLQRLLLTTRASQGYFYLAESLDWESAGLCKPAGMETGPLSLDSLRNSSTGTMAEGGTSVFYASNLHLLLHSYNSGHTFATAVDFSDDGAVKVNYSFLLTGAKASSGSGSTPASSSLPQPRDLTDNAAWSGPFYDWEEVLNHPGILTAKATETTTTGSATYSLRRNLVIAVEPDTIWIQPLPLETQRPLSKSTNEPNAPTSDVSSKPEGKVGGESSAPLLVAASLTRYWGGSQSHEPRLFTLQISRNSSVQVLVGPPESLTIDTTLDDVSSSSSQSEKDTFVAKHNLLPTLPGQFWLQPALLYREPQSSFKSKAVNAPVPLEDLLLWNASANSLVPSLAKPDAATIRNFASYALGALPALRIILERSGTGSQLFFCDFHEWASISENVNFYSRDLMSIYNHETLNQRLKRESMPVTFSGRSLSSTTQGANSKGVAFVIDIEVIRPAEEVIVGLRVELTDNCRPQFLSVYDRVVTLDADKKGKKKGQLFIDLPLQLSEILQVSSEETPTKELEPVRLYVGQSQHSDSLTSIDRVLVYTVPRSLIDPSLLVSHDTIATQNQQATNMQELMLRLSSKEARVARYNASLVKWFDRLMTSGFVTSIATPPAKGRDGLCEFTTPLYDNVDDIGSCVVASVTDFFQAAVAYDQETARFNLEEIQPFLTNVLTKSLPVAFVHPHSTTARTVTDFIHLHALCGNEDSTASLTSPRTILASLISDFLRILTSPTTYSRLSASTHCLAQFSRVWQLAHEYGGGVSASVSNDLTIQLFTALREHLLASKNEIMLPNMPTQMNTLWVKLLQGLLKVAIFVLAESRCNNSSTPSPIPVIGDVIVHLLTHTQSQIACNTRDLLCSILVCLFSGNRRIAKHFLNSPSFPSRFGPSLSSQPKVSTFNQKNEREEDSRKGSTNNVDDDDDADTLGGGEGSGSSKNTTSTGNFRLQRIRCPRFVPKRQGNLGSTPFVASSVNNSENGAGGGEVDDSNLEEIGRTLNEMLQFFASATNILGNDADDDDEEEEDNQGVAGSTDESLRNRWDGAISRYQSLRDAVDELRRSFGSRQRGRPSATVEFDANDPIRFMDELSEFEEDTQQHRGETGNSQEGSEAELAHKYGLLDDNDGARGNGVNENEGNVENAECGEEEEEASTEEDNNEDGDDVDDGDGEGKSGNSEGETEPTQDAEDDGDSDMARDIFQYVVDLLSTQPTDSEVAGNPSQGTVGAPNSSIASRPHVVSRDNEGGGGSSSSGNDTLSHESGLFDTAFLENIDEDVILNLALQRSIRDQGGPGTGAMLEEQVAQFRVSPQNIDESPLATMATTTNASNSTIVMATPVAKSTVWTQVLSPSRLDKEVGRKTSKESAGSGLSEGLLADLFDDMDATPTALPSTPSSSCASWSFSSHIDFPEGNGNDEGDKDEDSSDGEDDDGDDDDNHDDVNSSPPSSPPPDPPSGTLSFLPRDRQSLTAARACIALTRHLITVWMRVVDAGDEMETVAEAGDSRLLVPLMQTTFTLCRLLEVIAQCLELPESEEDLKETADAARTTLADLVTALATSLIRFHRRLQQSETTANTLLKPTPLSERLLLVSSLLARVLCFSSTSAAADIDKNHEDDGGSGDEEVMTTSSTARMVGKMVLSGLADPDSGESFFAKCMHACLNVVEALSVKWEKSRNWHLGDNMSSSTLATTTPGRRGHRTSGTFNLPHLTAGLFQCVRGVNFSSLTYGFGAGLTNCAPILDAQASLVHLHAPLHVDFDLQLTEAAVRLAISLFTCVRSGEPKRESDSEQEELKKRWCAVVYNLLQSLTSESSSFTEPVSATSTTSSSKIGSSVSIISRLVGLMRSLLVFLVGQKHYRQLKDIHLLSQALIRMRSVYEMSLTQEDNADAASPSSFYLLPLSYPSECLMLNCINTCLDVALSDRSSWQRLCLRKTDDLVFMLKASLRVRDILALGLLTLVLVAILPDAHQTKLGMTTFGSVPSSPPTKTAGSATSGVSATTSYANKLAVVLGRLLLVSYGESRFKDPSAFLLDFVRGNICCRADQRIRCTASLIMTTLVWYNEDDSLSTLLLQYLPKLWSELPSFALYGDELVLLSFFLFKRQPKWLGTPPFCKQLMELLLSQLNAVAEHPLRDIYKSVLKSHSLAGIASSATRCIDDPPFAGLHLPLNFISTAIPAYLPGIVPSNLIGCPFDSEPCLLCNHSILSSLPYVFFQWNSSTPSRRRGNASTTSSGGGGGGAQGSTSGNASAFAAIYPMPTYSAEGRLTNTSHVVTYAQAASSTATANASVGTATSVQPSSTPKAAPPVIELEPPTWVSPNVHVFSLLDTWEIACIGVRFMSPSPGLRHVRTLNIFTSDAFECPPSRLMQARHLWRRLVQVDIPITKYNVIVYLAAGTDIVLPTTQDPQPDPSCTVEVRLSEGLPLTANTLIFHYAAFHGLEEGVEGGDGDTEGGGERRGRRRRCCRCNVTILQGSTCQNCKQNGNQCSRCLFINLSDEEVFLCTKCGSSNYNFMTFFMLARPNFFHVSRLRDEDDRRVALSRIVNLTEELNTQLAALGLTRKHLLDPVTVGHPPLLHSSEIFVPLFWPRDHILKSTSEAGRVQQMAFPVVCRLWALRQAVSIYDGRCAANSMEVADDSTTIATVVSSSGGDARCLRCVEAAICLIINMASTFAPSIFSFEARKECISKGLPLAHSLSPVTQMGLVGFLNHITSNSNALINHLGDNIVESLLALSGREKEIFEFERSTYFNVVSLERSVKSVIAMAPPCGVDSDYFCQEARLRTIFRLLTGLTRMQQNKLRNGEAGAVAPPIAVAEFILAVCVHFLCDLFILPDNVKNWWWDRRIASFRPPRVNFEAWMRGDKAASFLTWREHYQLAVEMAKTEERVRKHITSTASRELALSARFALHWRHRTALAKLPPLSSHHESTANPGGWLAPILFHSFASHQYMSHQDSGLNLLTKLCLDTASTSTNRSAECLCYLASQCVPRLDHLVRANRGSGLTDESLRVNPLVMLMWDLTSGSTMKGTGVIQQTQRSCSVFLPQSNTAMVAPTSTPTTGARSMTPLPMRPLLLYRGKLLDHVGTLLQQNLTTLSAIEGMGDDNRPSLPPLRNWTDCLPSQLAPISGSSAAPSANPGYTLMHIADLLAILQPLNDLALEHQDRLYSYLLHAIVSLQPLVYQRTAYTVKAELLFKELLQQLMQNASSRASDLIRITMDYLVQCPVQTDGQSSAVFLLKRICACACPLPTDVAPFPVRVSVWRDQEEYLFVRRVREVVMSNTRGFGPTISDVINYICTENNLTTDMRLEVVCENAILMPQLLLEDVYKYLWLQNPNNANKAMELIYRIPGLEADNLPYVSRLPHPTIPEEQYSRLAILAEYPQGLAIILNRLDVVKDALKCRDLLHVSVHLLEYCLKVPQCQASLVDPQYRAIPILLDALYACLQVMHQSTSDFHDQVTSRLVGVLTTLLHSATTTASDADSLGLSRLLSCLALHPDLEVVQSGVAQLPGLLVFESEDKPKSSTNTDLLQCCCALVTAIPSNTPHGRRLRARVVSDLSLLELCVAYLWRVIPAEVLDQSEESTLDIRSPALSVFLSDDTLPFVLQLLRGCVWAVSNQKDPPTPPFPNAPEGRTTRQLLAFLHKLEDSKSVGRVGLLSEDLLNEWVDAGSSEGSATPASSADLTTILGVVATVRELRTLSEQRHRRNARECREKYLLSLNMKVNEKGQVAMTTASKLAEMAAQVVEETGLQCAICHEGPRSSPREELGIYVFIRRCKLEESLVDVGSASTTSVLSTQAVALSNDTNPDSEGYTTVSSFVVVHFECHSKAVQASNQSEWSVATRHNRDARCNSLLPILMNEVASDVASKDDKGKKVEPGGGGGEAESSESMDDLYAKRVSTYAICVTMLVSLPVSTRLALHDIKLLLLRFAHQRSFHGETGGGAAESNLNLIPHLMQLAFFQMKKEQTFESQRANLIQMLEKPESHWSSSCWDLTGPLYSAVVALHLLSREEWGRHRVALLRHLMALAHARATDGATAKEHPVFTVYKPYILFFGLIQAFYEYFFKSVKAPAGQGSRDCWWPEAVSRYIRGSDEQLLAATSELLSFFENDLSPIESVEEFLDVVGMLGEVDAQELIQLATTGSR